MTYQVNLRKNASLLNENQLLNHDVDALKKKIKLMRRALEEKEDSSPTKTYNIHELKHRRDYMMSAVEKEKCKLNFLCGHDVKKDACKNNKETLLQCLVEFQQLKWKLAASELSCIEYLIWKCETANYEDQVVSLQNSINHLLKDCTDMPVGFMHDAITETLSGKNVWG